MSPSRASHAAHLSRSRTQEYHFNLCSTAKSRQEWIEHEWRCAPKQITAWRSRRRNINNPRVSSPPMPRNMPRAARSLIEYVQCGALAHNSSRASRIDPSSWCSAVFNTKQGATATTEKNNAPQTVASVNRHISWRNGPGRAAPRKAWRV